MTLKASSNKFNPAYNLFLFTIKKNIGLIVLFSIFMLLVCPGYTLMCIHDRLKLSDEVIYNFDKMLPNLITTVSVVTALFAMLFCFINFSYLYSKKSTDVFHALPTTRTGLLISRFFASIVPVLIPIILVYIAMLGMIWLAPVSGSIHTVLIGMIYNILAVLFCSAFTLIFIICAGSVFDFLISFFTVNVGLILAITIFIELAQNFLVGFYTTSYDAFAYSASPFLFVFINIIDIVGDGFALGNGIIIFTIKLVILIVLFMVASCLLYNRRKSEKSGVSYAYRFMYVVCSLIAGVVGAFVLGLIFSEGNYNVIFWSFAVVGGVLTTITFGVITDRGFKTVKHSIIIGLCTIVVLAVTSVAMMAGGFGFSTRIPDENSVKSVSVEFNGYKIEFKDPSKMLSLHEKIVTNIDKQKTNDTENRPITIDYKLKAGFEEHRLFYIDYSEYMKQLLDIYKSQENIDSIKSVMSTIEDSNLTISEYKYNNEELLNDGSAENSEGTEEEQIIDVYLTKKEFVTLVDAYLKDVMNATKESILLENVVEYNISGLNSEHEYNSYSLFVEDSFKNTKKLLESMNLKERVQTKSDDKYID